MRVLLLTLSCIMIANPVWAQEKRADKTASLVVNLRRLVDTPKGFVSETKQETWPAGKTAIIVCDVWDAHHCLNAVRRIEEMVPRMNEVLKTARQRGILIIHAPSECMAAYADHPARKRAQAAAKASSLPREI